MLVAWAARRIGRPVKWTSDRSEAAIRALLRHFRERQLCLLHGVIARRGATISGRLDDNLLQLVLREVALSQSGTHVQAEFVPRAQRDHEGHEAARLQIDARPRPDFAPGLARDLLLDFGV